MASGGATTGDEYVPNAAGILQPRAGVSHRDDEYVQERLDVLARIQREHFWYRGRHRFLLRAVRRAVDRHAVGSRLDGIDLGGGCGGWVRYLVERSPAWLSHVALGDSSLLALQHARRADARIDCYQIDLMALRWRDRWDAAFLLDVIEHLPDDAGALREVAATLRPGGWLFITVPALQAFWSWNDDVARHIRRYARDDMSRLAAQSGLRLIDARYFMFYLSPLLWLARRRRPPLQRMSAEQIETLVAHTHRVPATGINALLAAIFAAETPLGHVVRFPFGTSLLAILRKPA